MNISVNFVTDFTGSIGPLLISEIPAIIQEATQLSIYNSILEQSRRKNSHPCAAGSGHL